VQRRLRSLLGVAAVAFAVLFTIAALAQYFYLDSQLKRAIAAQLQSWTSELRTEVTSSDHWDLLGYRRSSPEAPAFYIVDADGAIVDLEGFIPGMLPQVKIPFAASAKPFDYTSVFGEQLRVLCKPVRGGIVIVSVIREEAPADVDGRLSENAARFGATVGEAAELSQKDVDAAFDYAVIDDSGTVRNIAGGIPLEIARPKIDSEATFNFDSLLNDKIYAVSDAPILGTSNHQLGTIRAFKEISGERRMLKQSVIYNSGIAGVGGVVSLIIVAIYVRRPVVVQLPCARVLSVDESDTVEFKPSLRWDATKGRLDRERERAVVKTVAAFLNSRGGSLVIGVADNRQVIGLAADYEALGRQRNRDGFELALRQILASAVGERFAARNMRVHFCNITGQEICVLGVAPASEPVLVNEERRGPTLYIRAGNATKPLDTGQALKYVREHWGSWAA
jgi:hypothetical protein